MRTVESTDTSALLRAPERAPSGAARSTQLFSAVFESTRSSIGARADQARRREEAAPREAERDRPVAEREPEQPQQAPAGPPVEPSRSKRLEERVREREIRAEKPARATEPRAREMRGDTAPPDDTETDSGSKPSSVNEHVPSQDHFSVEGVPAWNLRSPSPPDGGGRSASGSAPDAAEPVLVGANRHAGPASTPASAGSPATNAGLNPSAPVLPPSAGNASSGGDPSTQAQRQSAGPQVARSAPAAENGPRPTPSDFQNLLQAAGRVRGQLGSPRGATLQTAAQGAESRGLGIREPGAVTELARLVRSNIGPRHATMVLNLDPPELGRLRIDVQMHRDQLTLRLQAESAQGHEALQSRLTQLRSALELHGVQVQQVDVELRPPGAPMHASNHQQEETDADRPGQQSETASNHSHESHPDRRDSLSGGLEGLDGQEEGIGAEPTGLDGTGGVDLRHPAESGVDVVV